MNYEHIRQTLAKLGIVATRPNSAGWLHIACPYAPWKHRNGIDRSRGFAIKVEDHGVSAFKCPACKVHGRISGIARGLGALRQKDYDEIARAADEADMLGTRVLDFDAQFTLEAMPDPLNEELFAGLFDPVADFKEARVFMVNRGVSRATCEKLKIEFDKEKRRVVFPVRNGAGELYGWSGRTVIKDHEPRILDYAGLPKRALILGEERWRPGKPKLIVEGLIAYARMHEIGAEEIVDIGALLGSALTEEKAAILKAHGCPVYPLLDPDKAGDQCLYGQWVEATDNPTTNEPIPGHFAGGGLIDVLASEIPVVLPMYPLGISDPDDFTIEQLRHSLATAELQGVSQAWLDKKSQVR